MSRKRSHDRRTGRFFVEWRNATRRRLVLTGFVVSASALLADVAKVLGAEPPKRDLRGFSLGMAKDQAANLASGQCKNFGTVSFQGGTYGEVFFDSVREHGRQFSCNFADGSVISYSVTPRTKKVYKLEGWFFSQMSCEELLAFVKETFGVGGEYAKFNAKPTIRDRCVGWTWRVAPGYELKVRLDESEAARFHVTLTDADIVRENEASAEEMLKRAMARPRL